MKYKMHRHVYVNAKLLWDIYMSHNGELDQGGCHPEIRPLGHFRGHQGQMILSSMFMFDRFEISGKPHIES